MSVLGKREPDPIGELFDTGFFQFISPTGISGLARVNDSELELLAVGADKPGSGQFRKFIELAKKDYNVISVWEIWNDFLGDVLRRYGFVAATRAEPSGEHISGYRWEATVWNCWDCYPKLCRCKDK